MTTIRLPEEGGFTPEVEAHLVEIRKSELERFGFPRTSNIWRCMTHWAPLVETTWRKSKAVRSPGRIDPLTRECIASAVSITNHCRY